MSRVSRDRQRVHLILASAAIAMVSWLIAPGFTQPDTKVDLVVSPWRYLGRALSAWNSHAGLGELQNQAYGYLFPMGPVFGVCHSLGVPPWAAQRVWWTILLLVAFLGMQRLIRALDVAGPGVALLGGAAYALSPRVLTVLSEISIAAWPMALTPWLVLAARPLLDPAAGRRRLVRASCLCGLLTAALGGVNATASGMALVLPFLLLLTHPTGRRRLLWWIGATLLGMLWWLLPLLVLGRYAYPFLDFIETAHITTAVTSVPNVLRGASHWVAYILDGADHPTWQAGWVLAQSVVAIVATCAVAALGVWGLMRMRRSHLLTFCLTGVLVGTIFMVAGHAGVVGSPVSEPVRALLDGPLAALRNVHKADPLIRLPLVLGLCSVVAHLVRSARLRRQALAGLAVVLVAVAMTPLWQGRAADAAGYAHLPQAWHKAAQLVDRRAAHHGGSTLLLPSSRTATYRWGTTTDEPLSALATSPVVYRAAAPLGHPGSTRILDAADTLAGSGTAQPALAAGLTRMGIARVVVRHDLSHAVGARPWQRVEATLRRSPGFTRVARIGHGRTDLTVWTVQAPRAQVTAYDSASAVTVAGGPESIFSLLALGAVGPSRPVLVRTGKASARAKVITDSMPWRVYDNGLPTAQAHGPTLLRSDRQPTRIGSRQLPPAGSPATQPARVLHGMTGLRASSSGADPLAKAFAGAGAGPAAAFDGDPHTAWLSGDQQATESLSFTLAPRVTVRRVVLRFARGDGIQQPDRVTVSVAGTTRTVRTHDRARLSVSLPAVRAGRVSIELHAPSGSIDPVMGLRSIEIPGAAPTTIVDVPQHVDPRHQSLLLHRDPRQRTQSGRAGDDPAVLRRQVTFTGAGHMRAELTLRPMPGPELDGLLRSRKGAVHLSCGAAGSLRIGNEAIPYAVRTTAGALRRGEPVTAQLCGGGSRVSVPSGTTQIAVTPASGLQASAVQLTGPDRAGPAAAHTARPMRVTASGSNGSTVRVGRGSSAILTLDQGFNAGWQATTDGGKELTPVEVDGWRQGFRMPSGDTATVHMTFRPTRTHRAGLLIGLLAVLVLAAGALVTRRDRRQSGHAVLSSSVPARRLVRIGVSGKWTLALGALLTVGVAAIAAGWWGALIGVAVCLVPWRILAPLGAAALVAAGLVMAAFGVVDAQSAGAIAGQLLGTVTLAALARVLGRRPG